MAFGCRDPEPPPCRDKIALRLMVTAVTMAIAKNALSFRGCDRLPARRPRTGRAHATTDAVRDRDRRAYCPYCPLRRARRPGPGLSGPTDARDRRFRPRRGRR